MALLLTDTGGGVIGGIVFVMTGMEHDGDALLIRHFLTGDNIPITIGILAQVVAHLQVIILFHSLRTVHLVSLVFPYDRMGRGRGDGKLPVPPVITSLDSRHGRVHQVAVSAVSHAQRLGGACERSFCPHGVVGNIRVDKLVNGLRHLDDGQRHAVFHGEREVDGVARPCR